MAASAVLLGGRKHGDSTPSRWLHPLGAAATPLAARSGCRLHGGWMTPAPAPGGHPFGAARGWEPPPHGAAASRRRSSLQTTSDPRAAAEPSL